MKFGEQSESPRVGYVFLFLVSLLIPLLYYFLVDDALEHHRYSWGLVPSHLLFLRYFGKLAVFGPVLALVFLLFHGNSKDSIRLQQ